MRILFALLYLCLASRAMAAPGPVNLVFILTDNQPASILGAYGNPEVRTPHIDRLAREGMIFTRAFAANGMCSPTRATLMTGLMPSQHGVHNWLDDEMMADWPQDWSAVGEFRSLPLTLGNRGYDTAMIGKWHLGQPQLPSLGFQHWVTFTLGHTVDFWHNTIIENGEVYTVEDRHSVDFFADKAVAYLESRESGKPFYLQLNLNGPYLNPPTNLGPARNRHYPGYLDAGFQSFPRVAANANVVHQLADPDTVPFLVEKHIQALAMHNDRQTMANVASQNTLVDDAVGRVLTGLADNGLEQSTLVVFSSDQGNFYGQHGLWQHTVVTNPANLYEAALNIPLIFRHPGGVPAGEDSDRLVGQYDIPVTLLDYLGIEVALEGSPGRSFAAHLRGGEVPGHREVFYEQEETRGIRTDRFAYWNRLRGTGEAELYDMQADPGQQHNLAEDPAHRETIADLDQRLTRFFERYSDPTYDLWRGGTAKGSVIRPQMFRALYGQDWTPQTQQLPPFTE